MVLTRLCLRMSDRSTLAWGAQPYMLELLGEVAVHAKPVDERWRVVCKSKSALTHASNENQ